MNKQNTEQLKKEINQIMNTFVTFSSELERKTVSDKIMELVEPHLISSDEIKREAVKEYMTRFDVLALLYRVFNETPQNPDILEELKATVVSLSQSKEGGE